MDNLYKYVEDSQKKQEDVDKDIKKEFKSQAQFLTNSNKKLNFQLQQMTTLHREDNLNIMKENCDLIESVAKLTESVKELQHEFLKIGGQKSLDLVKQKQAKLNQDQEAESSGQRGQRHAGDDEELLEQVDGFDNSIQKNLAVKRRYIQQLREQLNQVKHENQTLQQKLSLIHI